MIKLIDLLETTDIYKKLKKEGAKVDFKDNVAVGIKISSKNIEGEQLVTIDGSRVTNGYKVYYSLESDPNASNIKASQNALKYDANLININELKELILKTLKNRLPKIDYIGFLESKGELNNTLLKAIQEIYKIPSENIIYVKKMEYKFIDNAVDWDSYLKQTKEIQQDIQKFLDKTASKPGPYKIRKSGETQSIIIKQLHSKYDLGLNPNEPNRPLPPIFNVIVDCIKNKKVLLLIDDNFHTGTDFFKIFNLIDKLIEKMQLEASKPSDKEHDALIQLQTIIQNPKFKTSAFLQDKYKNFKQIEKQLLQRKFIVSKQFYDPDKVIFGYVLYKLKPSDID
jgi:hypothetical protein